MLIWNTGGAAIQKYLVDTWKCRPGDRKDISDVDVKCLGVIRMNTAQGEKYRLFGRTQIKMDWEREGKSVNLMKKES